MTRLAVLADIHGNADALAAVLVDVHNQSPDALLNLGDCFSGPLDAARTAHLLAGTQFAATVRGNHDRWLADPNAMDEWDRRAHPQLAPETLTWLASLPATAVIDDAFLCHATPQDDLSYWLEAYTPDGTARRANLDRITSRANGIPQSLLLCGHTHVARSVRLTDGRLVVNPGSVGCPGFTDRSAPSPRHVCAGTPYACYAILDRHGASWTVNHRLVPYDTTSAVARARAAGFEDWVQALGTGWIS
jgi:diadenosine tetraphosphatase ApaH/serine/threonine PP2A family protein phosphatase